MKVVMLHADPYLFFVMNSFKPSYSIFKLLWCDVMYDEMFVCVGLFIIICYFVINCCIGLAHQNASWEVFLKKQNQYGESSRP